MDELIALLDQADNLAELDDAQLDELQAQVTAEATAAAEASDDDETLAAVERAVAVVTAIRAEQDARAAASAERADRAATLLAQLQGGPEEGEEEAEETPEAEPAEEPAEEPEAVEVTAEAEPVSIAAAAPAPMPVVSRVAARRAPSRAQVKPAAVVGHVSDWGLVASANAPSIPAGQPIRDEQQLADVFLEAWAASENFQGLQLGGVRLARAGKPASRATWGDRFLDGDPITNAKKVEDVTSLQAITASGGTCAPSEVRYDIPTLGSTERPMRDSGLARFGADRGGVRLIPPAVLSDVAGGLSVWTEANDTTPSSPATKPCVVMTCPEDDETLVDAITRCLQIGNFRARYFPEQVADWVQKLAIAHARLAEQTLITAVGTGSTAVSAATVLGTTRNILSTLDRAIAGMRYRHRLPRSFTLRLDMPEWLMDEMRTDLARQMPVGTVEETLAVADATIQTFFSARNVRITLLKEGESGQSFGAQADGTLLGWPTSAILYLYPEGSWLFLDGGTLDLGIWRDSTLVGTNDARMFAESFEAAAFHGVESLRITVDTCPDGAASALIDIDPCTSNS